MGIDHFHINIEAMSLSKPISALRGPWVWFGVFLALVASLFVVYAVNIIQWRNSPDFGWRTMYDSGPNFVAEVFQRGKDAGLQVGDVILAINGRTYATFDELYFRVRSNEPGLQNNYTVNRNGLTLQVPITTGRLGFPTVLKRSGPIFAVGLVYALIGVLVFLMKPKAGESWLFLVMTCILGMEIGFGAPSDLMRPLWFLDIRLLINALLPASIIHLAVKFPKARTFLIRRPWLWIVPYLFSFALFISHATDFHGRLGCPPRA